MIFDIMLIVFMAISIIGGNVAGSYLGSIIGIGGAFVGALIVGLIIYFLYSLISGQKTNLVGAFVFGILNYLSTMLTTLVGSNVGIGGGIVTILVQALILSILWGWMGGKAQPEKTVKTGLKP